jgi:hypothetical protein
MMSCSVVEKGARCANAGRLKRGLCNMHYHRWRTHGDPLTVREQIVRCTIVENGVPCFGKHDSRGWCAMHWRRWSKHGDPLVVHPQGFKPGAQTGPQSASWKGADIGYPAAHMRVRALHGKASDWPCSAQCGKQAREWAYCHDSSVEKTGWTKDRRGGQQLKPFSPDDFDYVPLCHSCHVKIDRVHANV